MVKDLVLIGVITGAHGLKGEVRIKTFTTEPQNINAYGPLALKNGHTLTILGLRSFKDTEVIARLKESIDRNAAEALRGQELYVERAQLPELEEEEYYHNDLLSLRAITEEQTEIGKVIAVQNFGASDILEIQTLEGTKVMVPFIDDAIIEVNLEQGFVTIRAAFVVD
jgi:16S rRNA processing protein RimM